MRSAAGRGGGRCNGRHFTVDSAPARRAVVMPPPSLDAIMRAASLTTEVVGVRYQGPVLELTRSLIPGPYHRIPRLTCICDPDNVCYWHAAYILRGSRVRKVTTAGVLRAFHPHRCWSVITALGLSLCHTSYQPSAVSGQAVVGSQCECELIWGQIAPVAAQPVVDQHTVLTADS
jgi:hypothetical protein